MKRLKGVPPALIISILIVVKLFALQHEFGVPFLEIKQFLLSSHQDQVSSWLKKKRINHARIPAESCIAQDEMIEAEDLSTNGPSGVVSLLPRVYFETNQKFMHRLRCHDQFHPDLEIPPPQG